MNLIALYILFIPICFFVLLFNVKFLKGQVKVGEFGWTLVWSFTPVFNMMLAVCFLVLDLCLFICWCLKPWDKQIDAFFQRAKKWFDPDRKMF